MKKYLILILMVCLIHKGITQNSGLINYEKLGLSFRIPEGWIGQESDGMYLMGSNTKAGLIIIQPHHFNREELQQQAQEGIQERSGTFFQLEGGLQSLDKNSIGGYFSGMMEWENAKAFIVGLPKPFTYNPGITISAITTPNLFDDSYRDLCLSILKSVQFKEVDRKAELDEWRQYLSNSRLTYMESYYSGSGASGLASGGYSSKKIYDLCSQGYFTYSGRSSMSIDALGASASSASKNNGNGKWNIVIDSDGNPALQLLYYNGEEYIFVLSYENEKLYLNNTRYFKTNSGEYAPNCY
jgi:hypothetical protein